MILAHYLELLTYESNIDLDEGNGHRDRGVRDGQGGFAFDGAGGPYFGWGAAALARCSSSSVFRLDPQYACDGGPTYSERLEAGEDIDLPMYTQGYTLTAGERTLEGEEANFRLRLGSNVTIETPTSSFAWEGVGTDVGSFGASRTRDTTDDGVIDTELTLVSQCLDFVQFGFWQEIQVDVSGDFAYAGGACRQGLETTPVNLPVLGATNYNGPMLGVGSLPIFLKGGTSRCNPADEGCHEVPLCSRRRLCETRRTPQ